MFLSIIENNELEDDWFELCKLVKDDILENKTIKSWRS